MKYGAVLFVLALIVSIWGSEGQVEVSISSSSSFSRGSPVSVSVNIRNLNRDSTFYFLKWGTPLETNSEFEIMFGNVTVPYEGIAVYRIPTPKQEDYIELKEGETTTVNAELWKSFDFNKDGTYHVRLALPVRGYILTPTGEKAEFVGSSVYSNEIEFTIIKNDDVPVNHPFRPSSFHVLAYECSSSQLDTIGSAFNTARSRISSANSNFNGGSSLYRKWFGVRNTDRENRVKSVLGRLNSVSSLRYSCGGSECRNEYYAYVYPTDSTKRVYLCPQFWPDFTERVRTLVHEVTHFNDVGATRDYAYGQSNCVNLANNSPSQAIYNADNFCYYVY